MLVVLLILVMSTGAALLALNTAQSELRATGNERVALQTRYVSEAAMVTTIAWIDMLGSTGQWLQVWNQWQTQGVPNMDNYPEPEIGSGVAARVTMQAQRLLRVVQANEVPVLDNPSNPGGTGGGGGSGGTGGGGFYDPVGSFGPAQAYDLPEDTGYVVDVTDCQVAPGALAPGSPLGGGGGSFDVIAFNCVLTARGRLEVAAQTRSWTYGTQSYAQRTFASAHEARATILTPEMIVPK